MSISRRLMLGSAASLAAVARVPSGFAAPRPARALSSAQRFLELLIHHDEAGREPHRAMLYIPASDSEWFAIDTLDAEKYRRTNHLYRRQGYRLRRVSSFHTREGVRYAACWQLASGPEWHTRHAMTREAFEGHRADYARRGFRMSHLDARAHYAAIWERGDASTQQIVSGLSLRDYEAKLAELTAADYRPIRVSTTTAVGQPQFAAIFEKTDGRAWTERHEMSVGDFKKAGKQLAAQGYRLADASGHMQDGKPKFAGVWERT
ncbi:MAG TPA: hypothetical protein VG889_19845 [Rhizomicrobium sp.]|nr:hypothetical protein [Rhizomicrobium sp.]